MTDLDKLIENLIQEKGGSRKDYLNLLNSIAYHESAGTMDPKLHQYGGGPGRGKYQFEVGQNMGGITAARRAKKYFSETGLDVPEWLNQATEGKSLDTSTLGPKEQDVLFLANMRMHPKADFSKVWNNEESIQDFWANYHWAGPDQDRDDRIKSFNSSLEEYDKVKKNSKPNRIEERIPEVVKDNTNIQQPQIRQMAMGGSLASRLYNRNINEFNTGGVHESNMYGGIPQGTGSNGKVNTVEQGETSYNLPSGKFIFSNRLSLNSSPNLFRNGGKIDPPTDKDKALGSKMQSYKEHIGNSNMYLDEGSKAYSNWIEQDKYFNPPRPNYSTGDWKQDILYNNPSLMDIPILGNKIKEEAKKIASNSGGVSVIGQRGKESDYEKYTGQFNESNSEQVNLVDQYFSDKPLFSTSKYKPTSDYLEFLPSYSVKGDLDKSLDSDPLEDDHFTTKRDRVNYAIEKTLESLYPRKSKMYDILDDKAIEIAYEEFIKNKKPYYGSSNRDGELSRFLNVNLAGHKTGAAWDKKLDLPYVSISDAWDFEPTHYANKWGLHDSPSNEYEKDIKKEFNNKAYIQSYLMHKAGRPFKVYDRFYFDPKTKQYIPDSEIEKRKKKK